MALAATGYMPEPPPLALGPADGTWTLSIFVTDLQVERNLRVRGDVHIGGVMIKLVDELGERVHLSCGEEPNTANGAESDKANERGVFSLDGGKV